MHFGFSDEQNDFRASVAAFAKAKLAPHYASDDRAAVFRRELLEDLAGQGIVGLRIPEEYGGQGADAVTTGVASEEVSRVDINAAYVLLIASLVGEIINSAADERQRQEWLPPMADGSHLPCFCLTEPDHGSDAANLAVRARPDGAAGGSPGRRPRSRSGWTRPRRW